jgi:integrase
VQKAHVALHKALADALRIDLVARNVADLVDKPKAHHVEMQVYTPEQAQQLLTAARGNRLEALYVLMLTTGCRLGELLGLRWQALDLERRELHVSSVLKEVKNKRSLGNPKTPHSRRTIPLTQLAVDLLHEHHVAQTVERLQHGTGWNRDQLVFCTTTGTAYAMTNWQRQQYQPLLKKAGLPYIRPHDLRHTAATLLLLDKVPAIVVSRMLGHANVAFTLQTYGHILAEMREEARDAMERRFGNAYKVS